MKPEESDLGDAAGYARHQWIEEILVKVREGNATDEEVEKLQGALMNDREARRVYLKLFERYPHMTLPEQDIVWRTLPFFRGIEKLEVVVLSN